MSAKLDDVVPLIPYLRRHARLLSGTKDIGDEYVRLCLELVSAEPERLDGDDLKLRLFLAFHQCWNVISQVTAISPEAIEGQERLEDGLAALAPLERRVLLLSVVEEFSPGRSRISCGSRRPRSGRNWARLGRLCSSA